MLVQGAGLLTPEFCEKNPKTSYNEHKLSIKYTRGNGKHQKVVKELLVFQTRKPRLVSQHINLCKEAYEGMLETPTSDKLKKVWRTLSVRERLKYHFDLIAHDLGAVSYNFEILDD